jgi:hypothetical protein
VQTEPPRQDGLLQQQIEQLRQQLEQSPLQNVQSRQQNEQSRQRSEQLFQNRLVQEEVSQRRLGGNPGAVVVTMIETEDVGMLSSTLNEMKYADIE